MSNPNAYFFVTKTVFPIIKWSDVFYRHKIPYKILQFHNQSGKFEAHVMVNLPDDCKYTIDELTKKIGAEEAYIYFGEV